MKELVEIERFAAELVSLDVTDLTALAKVLKEKYGLEATQAVMAVKDVEPEAEQIEEKTSFTVKLIKVSEVTSEKLNTVKEVNKILVVGLQAAMALIKEQLPLILKENISKVEAEEIKSIFNILNAEIELS